MSKFLVDNISSFLGSFKLSENDDDLTWQEILDKNHIEGLKFVQRSLWPALHSMLNFAEYDSKDWLNYIDMNEAVAQEALAKVNEDQVVIAKGVEFLLLAESLNRSGSMLVVNTPWPTWEIFCTLPWQERILTGMLKYEKIIFSSKDFGTNFLRCCHKSLGYSINLKALTLVIHLELLEPVLIKKSEIDYDYWENLAYSKNAPLDDANCSIILSIDTLDCTSSLHLKIEAIEDFFRDHPGFKKNVIFIIVISQSGADMDEEIPKSIGRINGKFSSVDWSPIRFISRKLDHPDLAYLYRQSDVMLFTPLRSGNHTFAQEFIACQVGSNPGVLIMTKYADIDPESDYFKYAIPVNPYMKSDICRAINEAIQVSDEDKSFWMLRLQMYEKDADVDIN